MTDHNSLLTISILLVIFMTLQILINVLVMKKLFVKPFVLKGGNARDPVVGRGIKGDEK